MNIIKKVYCRMFQGVFRLAQPFLPYRMPVILNKVEQIADELSALNINSVLLVTDEFLHKSGLLDSLKQALSMKSIYCAVYDKTVANPTTQNVEEARKLYIEKNCRALIGFGGGSSIDCAKVVAARIAKPKQSIAKMEGILKILKKLPPVFAVPTTAGTGSETTVTAVITDDETRHKFPISDFPLIPAYAVLDPNVVKSLPPSLTATTGMDALVHAIEAYIGRSTNKETRYEAEETVRLVFGNIETSYHQGDDLAARANMLQAAFLAGDAFSKSYVGYCHAVAHSLGGLYNTPHGLANAVLIPYTLEIYGETVYIKLKRLAVVGGLCNEATSEKEAATMFIEKIRMLNRNMGIPEKLSGIQSEEIPKLARYADKEANPVYPVPKLMNAKELECLYYAVKENE